MTSDPILEPGLPLGDGPGEPLSQSEAVFPLHLSDEQRRAAAAGAFWTSVAVLHRSWKLIAAVTVLTAVASVVVSLQLPLWYAASTRVMPPEGGSSGGLGALIGDLSPIASSLIGGGGGDYSRYLAILGSRSMHDTLVARYDLIRVYETEDAVDPQGEAVKKLAANTTVEVDMETDALSITVLDRDPQRAAQMANFYVSELNRRNEALGLEGASRFREYIESRYQQIELEMAAAREAMTAFQQANSIVELPTMAQGLMQAAASQQAEIARIEIQYEALLAEFGPDNERVVGARRALETARQGQADLLEGREMGMPLALDQLPTVAGEYARLYQELLIQQALMEQARPLLEQARFDEERDRVAVQVLDPATPPVRKAKPKRAFVVIGATLSAFSLLVLWALLAAGVRRRQAAYAAAFARARQEVR